MTGTQSRTMPSGEFFFASSRERRYDLQALDRALALLALGRLDLVAEELLLLLEVEVGDEVLDRLGPHSSLEVLAVAVLELAPLNLVVDDLLHVEVLEQLEDVSRHSDVPLGTLAYFLLLALALILGRCLLGAASLAGLHLLETSFRLLEDLLETAVPVGLEARDLVLDLLLEIGEVLMALVLID